MKLLTPLVLLAGATLAWIAWRAPAPQPVEAGAIPRTLSEAPAAGHVVRTFGVEGICCQSCPERLREAARALPGVTAVAVDPTAGRVQVEADASLATDDLTAALTFGDYVAHPLAD